MKKIISLLLVIIVLFRPALVAYASGPYMECGSSTGNISIKSYSNDYDGVWVDMFDAGIEAWNSSSANVTISTTYVNVNTIEAARYNDTWYGHCEYIYNPLTKHIISFDIKINARTISESATNFFNFAKSVIVHEFGHVFWLDDNPSTTEASIMDNNRDRNTMTEPQQYDINNVNAKYN